MVDGITNSSKTRVNPTCSILGMNWRTIGGVVSGTNLNGIKLLDGEMGKKLVSVTALLLMERVIEPREERTFNWFSRLDSNER